MRIKNENKNIYFKKVISILFRFNYQVSIVAYSCNLNFI